MKNINLWCPESLPLIEIKNYISKKFVQFDLIFKQSQLLSDPEDVFLYDQKSLSPIVAYKN